MAAQCSLHAASAGSWTGVSCRNRRSSNLKTCQQASQPCAIKLQSFQMPASHVTCTVDSGMHANTPNRPLDCSSFNVATHHQCQQPAVTMVSR